MNEELYLEHYGTKRHSGRFEWGSGENPYQHEPWYNNGIISKDKVGFYKEYRSLKEKGMTEGQIVKYIDDTYFGGEGKFKSTVLRSWITIGKEQLNAENISRTYEMKERGMSNVAIGEKLGVNESVVRSWLDPARKEKLNKTRNIANALKSEVDEKLYLDVGIGTEKMLACSKQALDSAIAVLEEEGYKKQYLKVPQQGNPGKYTWVQVLTKDDVPWKEVNDNMDKVQVLTGFQSLNGGKTITPKHEPVSIDSNRVKIRYAEEGGIKKDGVMEIRPGVADLNLGNDAYAQVRIAVDNSHYLKGMAIYGNPKDFPKGVDIIFNTNKGLGTDLYSVLKPLKKDEDGKLDPDLPFGANTKNAELYLGSDGKEHDSAINKVNSDEDWKKWSKNLASQFLSKQDKTLAKRQLALAYDSKESEFELYSKLENPTLKKKLLEEFADECESSAVHLKGAPLSGQATHVILPVMSLKDNEIYAPNYIQGEEVVLIRYPHGGIFEIPRLKVNNQNKEGKDILGQAKHAVGINSTVAEQLSGADFDGDTVVVIPVRGNNIKTKSRLNDLKDFDPKIQYKAYEGMPEVGPKSDGFRKPYQMGIISNLITDMTIGGATDSEIAKAVKHSMVIIDAEKHNLDWRRSAIENDISYLHEKYQGKKLGGASTIIARAKGEYTANKRKEILSTNQMTPEELKRYNKGEKIFRETGELYLTTSSKNLTIDQKKELARLKSEYSKAQKEYYKEHGSYNKDMPLPTSNTGLKLKTKKSTEKTTKMAYNLETYGNANNLIGINNAVIEHIYADHANRLHNLANEARKEARITESIKRDPIAAKTYSKEVESLMTKLKKAELNSPLERQAQMLATSKVNARTKDNPDITKEELKKIKVRALADARAETGAGKQRIKIEPKEWEAIQNRAISNSVMLRIMANTDDEDLKKLATPKNYVGMTPNQIAKAKRFLKNGYTQAEVAEYLGVSPSTIEKYVEF